MGGNGRPVWQLYVGEEALVAAQQPGLLQGCGETDAGGAGLVADHPATASPDPGR
jgi:hypothetical protein